MQRPRLMYTDSLKRRKVPAVISTGTVNIRSENNATVFTVYYHNNPKYDPKIGHALRLDGDDNTHNKRMRALCGVVTEFHLVDVNVYTAGFEHIPQGECTNANITYHIANRSAKSLNTNVACG